MGERDRKRQTDGEKRERDAQTDRLKGRWIDGETGETSRQTYRHRSRDK